MEDFGFKLQNIKNKYDLKKIAKAILIFLPIIFSILILIKITKMIFRDSYDNIDSVALIKSNVKNIKRLPKEEGGLAVDNLDISVYDVIDNNDTDLNPVVKKTKQDINFKKNIDSDILLEQDLLTQKINELNQDSDVLNNEKQIKIKSNEIYNESSKNKSKESKTNIKINNDRKKSTTDINDLKKLENQALIKNLKAKKDIKPGSGTTVGIKK